MLWDTAILLTTCSAAGLLEVGRGREKIVHFETFSLYSGFNWPPIYKFRLEMCLILCLFM